MTASQIIERISALHVVCVGDVMLDRTVYCKGGRLSPEAPVIIFNEMEIEDRVGGGGNVAANVAGLGAACTLIGMIGNDEEGEILTRCATSNGNHALLVAAIDGAPPVTTRKVRYVSGGQQILRIDRDGQVGNSPSNALLIADAIHSIDDPIDAILVSDYAKGMVSAETMAACRCKARDSGAILLVDPKGRDWMKYGDIDVIKPNEAELSEFVGFHCGSDDEIERAIVLAFDLCDAKTIIVTRNSKGATLGQRDGVITHFPTAPIDVVDVCGAGDSNFAAFGVALAAHFSLEVAAWFGQIVSRIAVTQHGTSVVRAGDVLNYVDNSVSHNAASKVTTLPHLIDMVKFWRRQNCVIGFTNGCYDMLHIGHISTLRFSKSQCDKLIVAINSDQSVRFLKGDDRPIFDENDRAVMISSLDSTDAVLIFDQISPEDIIRAIRPDVLVKGMEYSATDVVGADILNEYGGKVILSPMIEGYSTSKIVRSISSRSGTR